MTTEASGDLAAARQLVASYLTAVHAGDTAALALIFEPGATLIGWDEGELRRVPLQRWFSFVDSIPSPESEGDPLDGEILDIDLFATAGSSKVRETYRTYQYVNYLSLLKIGDQWKITGKCYHQFR